MRSEFNYDKPETDLIILRDDKLLKDCTLKEENIVSDTKLEVKCKNPYF